MTSYDGTEDTHPDEETAPTAEDAEVRMPPPPEATEPEPDPEPTVLTDGAFEYLHIACQSVAFRLPRMPTRNENIMNVAAPGQGHIPCHHCGANLVKLHHRHIRPTES